MKNIKEKGKNVSLFFLAFLTFVVFISFNFIETMAEENQKEFILIDPTKPSKQKKANKQFSPISPIEPSPIIENQEKIIKKGNEKLETSQKKFEETIFQNSIYIDKRNNYEKRMMDQIAEEMQLEIENMTLPSNIEELKKENLQYKDKKMFFINETTLFNKEQQFQSRMKKVMNDWEKKNPVPDIVKIINEKFEEIQKEISKKGNNLLFMKEAKEELKKRKYHYPTRNGIQTDGTGLG